MFSSGHSSTRFIAIVMMAMAGVGLANARDLGNYGEVFPIIETDLLLYIKGRLQVMQDNGELDKINKQLQARANDVFTSPRAINIPRATKNSVKYYDPTLKVYNDIKDDKGNIIAPKGLTMNPLENIILRSNLYFIDGDSQKQLQWAMNDPRAKIILIKGNPMQLINKYNQRFYFDQFGSLTKKFAIDFYPAKVSQDGARLKIEMVAGYE